MSLSNQNQHLLSLPEGKQHHDLQFEWTFWYLIPNRTNSKNTRWEDFLKELLDFHSFEDFWGIYNAVEPAKNLPKGCRYYVFRKGVRPLWEDVENSKGFDIHVEYPIKRKNGTEFQDSDEIQKKWLDVLLTVLAYPTPLYDCINGVEYNSRRDTIRIGVWTKEIDDSKKEVVMKEISKVLQLKDSDKEKPTASKMNDRLAAENSNRQ
uniref:Eukaryotic initiation factor 4E family protein n=1 Tax=Coptotermes formosanus TaxID=36987 RepID=R4ULY2_COPFO|nr:eukaryotic initiation factor 4E family protein [Coptotermes formosanus]